MERSYAIQNKQRCPACNKLGSYKLGGYCKKCYAQMPTCAVHNCNEERIKIRELPSRYCEKHHYGMGEELLRNDFNQPENDPQHGYRQAPSAEFGLETDEFPIAR